MRLPSAACGRSKHDQTAGRVGNFSTLQYPSNLTPRTNHDKSKIRLVSSSHQVNTVMNSLSQTGSLLFHRAILRQDIPGIETHRMRRLHKICHNRKSVHLNTHTHRFLHSVRVLAPSYSCILFEGSLKQKDKSRSTKHEGNNRQCSSFIWTHV